MAFFELMRMRRKAREEPLSERSEDILKDALSQLITYHQDFGSLLFESSSLTDIKKESGQEFTHDQIGGEEWVNLCPIFLCQEAVEQRRDISLHAAETCAMKLLQLIRSDGNDKTPKLEMLVKVMKQMIQKHRFNKEHFLGVMCKQSNLTLELLWQLHREDICSVESFLSMKLSDGGFVEWTSIHLACLLRIESDNSSCIPFVSGILSCLVNIGFSENNEGESATRKVAVSILDDINKKLLDQQICGTEVLFPICVVDKNVAVLMKTVKTFSTHCLSLLMGYKPVYKVSRAIRDQKQWTFAKISTSLRQCFKQILLQFDPHEVIAALQHILDIEEVNWQIVLSFTSVLLICLPQAPRLLEDYVMGLLREGLDNTDMEKTITGFLFARQACYEGPHVFCNYQDWFQQVFGENTKSPASTRKSFIFLMKFLTDLVPFESAHHLKVHILRPPCVPPKCREILMDYIALAKTRLSDFKESVDNIDMYDDTGNQIDKQKGDKVEADVAKAVVTFECTNKIPSTVMEASIFRKPFYVGRFLPVLLKPRPLPDAADTKMKFIEALKRAEKIPESLYMKYKKACLSEAARLLEGVFMETDDDAVADMDLLPLDQLKFRLTQLGQAVIEQSTHSEPQTRVPDLMSLTRERLSLLLPDPNHLICGAGNTDRCIVISGAEADLSTTHNQIVESILDFYSKTVVTLSKMETDVFGWALQFSTILAEFTPLHKSLLRYIWKLVTEKGPILEENHIFGLAAMCASMEGQKEKFGDIRVIDSCHFNLRKQSTPFLSALWLSLPLRHAQGMIFSLRFIDFYLKFAFSLYGEDGYISMITPQLVTQFFYLCTRLVPEICYTRSPDNFLSISDPDLCKAAQLFTCHTFQQSLQKYKVEFSDWVALEIHINSEDDVLTSFDRQEYYLWVIYEHFMVQCQQKPSEMCTVLIQSIMEADMSCMSSSHSKEYTNRTGNSRVRPTSSNRNSILSILQQLLGFLGENVVDGDLWLLNELERLVAKHSQCGDSCIQTQWAVTSFFGTALLLPQYLFFSNSVGKICAESLKKLSTVINHYMAHYCTEGCQLPLHLTLYIAQGLQQIIPNLHKSDWPVMNDFLESCPIVILSLFAHITKIKYLVQIWKPYRTASKVLNCFFDVTDWIERCESNHYCEPAGWEPVWMYAAAIYSIATHNLDKVKLTVQQLVGSVMQTKKISQILYMYGDFLCCRLATLNMACYNSFQSAAIGDLLWQLLLSYPQTLKHLTSNNSNQEFTVKVTSPTCLKQRHISLLGLLKSQAQILVLELEESVSSMVKLFATICQQFEEMQEVDINSRPLTMKTVMEFSSFVKSCISSSPARQLSCLDEDAVKICGPDVVAVLKQRLRQLKT